MVQASGAKSFHRRVAVDTPEHVRLDYVLADIGSRAAALAIDLLILVGTSLALGLAAYYSGRLGEVLESLSTTILILAVFMYQFGYFMLFEGLGGGRTPGKRAVGLRVLHVGGEPLSFQGSVLRNLIRVVDLQPGGTGVAGAISILLNRRAQRLGDLVAGTMVVRDAGGGDLLVTDALPPGRVGRPLLSVDQFELLAGYLARRSGLEPRVRERVAWSVFKALAVSVDLQPAGPRSTPEATLARLHEEEAPRHAARRGGAGLQAATMARERREEWAAYSGLVEKGRKRGLQSFSEREARRFGRLYRGMTADLERARTYGASPGLLGTVQRWAGAGHNLLYRVRGRVAISAGRWVAVGFPRSVRRFRRPILLAALFLLGPMVATYAAVEGRPLLARSLVSPGMFTRAESTVKDDIDARYLEEAVGPADMPVLSSRLITNNIGVTFMTFAGGLLAGAGTLYILVYNGISLGAALGAYANEGVLGVILAFVFSHGFLELGAICIAGGAGFGLGSALLMPGRRTRAEALRERGRTFVSLLAGTSLMLVVAGLIEGFYSPSALPAAAKFTLGSVTAVLMALYFGLAGRKAGGPPAAVRPSAATAVPSP